jgi:hypothetical protein
MPYKRVGFDPNYSPILKNLTLARATPSPIRQLFKRVKRRLFPKTAEQRFVALLSKRIDAGWEHSTLGPSIRDEAYTRGKADEWAQRMIEYGLKPDHLCVEYGCGSLWAAEPIIHYLDAGRYYGIDITDKFYEFGRARLADLLRDKQVRLGVITDETVREVAALNPDFVFARKVLPHVAEDALQRFLTYVATLMSVKTIAVLDNTPMLDAEGKVTGRRYTVEKMQKLLPAGYEIRQERYAAIVRRLR